VLLEAMAARVPVASTRVGGIPEMVEDGTSALLVPRADPVALGNAISKLLTDAELSARLVEAARERITARHSPEARVRFLAKLYTDLAGH
jgi:glycosyltransferase involved in cell wall biosynthesis